VLTNIICYTVTKPCYTKMLLTTYSFPSKRLQSISDAGHNPQPATNPQLCENALLIR